MITRVDLDRLKKDGASYDLFQIAARASGQTSGVVDVDISGLKLMSTTRTRFAKWAARNQPTKPEESVPPPAPAEPLPEQINLAEYEREQLQRATDEARGLARIEQYAVEQGLERSSGNADAIKDWLEKNAKGYISAAGVDAAIQNLGPKGLNRLTWRKPEGTPLPPPAPVVEPPSEVLADWQLPIDSDELTMKRASVKALQDLIKRRRAATNQKYIRCGFGSSF